MALLVSLACAASILVAAGFGAIIMHLIYERNASRGMRQPERYHEWNSSEPSTQSAG